MGYYYWRYVAHPDSSFSFDYDGIVYAPDARSAYLRSDVKLNERSDYEYQLGVHLVLQIDGLVAQEFGSVEETTGTAIRSDQSIQQSCRDAVTTEMLRTIGEQQETASNVYPRRQQRLIDWPYAS